jgi:phenylpropionate dioxygenase-like ring-hydroxylating dioxygenase large terminal subunit
MRFAKTGDWIKYNIAGYAFILVKDREGNVNAFHNICRHRAFPVVTGDGGTSRIFSCQYHGWSYGLNGKLAKAPGYQELEGFDKSKNGLLPIHSHVDDNGFIWLNLDADDFEDIDLQARLKDFNHEEYEFDNAWETTGDFNWKTLAHIYNERYQGQTSSPDRKFEPIAESLRAASTYYFPNATMTVS